MAKKSRKKRASKRAKARSSLEGKTIIGRHKYGDRQFGCYGKRVRAGKSTKKIARMFCAKAA